jgi:hypothetical protein
MKIIFLILSLFAGSVFAQTFNDQISGAFTPGAVMMSLDSFGKTVPISSLNPMSTSNAKIITTLFSAVTTTPATPIFASDSTGPMVAHAFMTGAGAVSATVTVYGNTTASTTGAVVLGTLYLSGTGGDTQGLPIMAEWPYIYAIPSAITGSGAVVTTRISS